jgi:2-dehydropantoate 2-reductase
LWDVESAAEAIRPIVGSETAVVPLQNGIDAHERMIPILGSEAVMGGSALVTGSIVAPGVVRQTGTYFQITFGELGGGISARGERLRDQCAAAGLDVNLSPDIRVPLWEKYISLVPIAGVNALTRRRSGSTALIPIPGRWSRRCCKWEWADAPQQAIWRVPRSSCRGVAYSRRWRRRAMKCAA